MMRNIVLNKIRLKEDEVTCCARFRSLIILGVVVTQAFLSPVVVVIYTPTVGLQAVRVGSTVISESYNWKQLKNIMEKTLNEIYPLKSVLI